jgi:hypothetical protein
MDKNYGYFEFSFQAGSILTGTYGNNANPGVVFPEMARKIDDKPGLAGRYASFWLESGKKDPIHAVLEIEEVKGQPLAFEVHWGTHFKGFGNLLAPDRLVGWYEWGE